MGYARKFWKDHIVERPRTYTEVVNPDGTKTYIPAPGEILQLGSAQSATNFNSTEEGLQHYAVAFDEIMAIHQAILRSYEERIKTLEEQMAILGDG